MKAKSTLFENISAFDIILATKSPRRKQLMEGLGLAFSIKTKDVDESFPDHLKKEEIPLYLCEKKAKEFESDLKSNTIIITADTIVWHGNRAINKPANRNEAIEMLNRLSGKKHTVYTGVCITSSVKSKSFYDETDVYFKNLYREEIEYYIDQFQPYDKAGAYGAQEFIGYIGIDKIVGSYFNVMGLPVKKVYEELRNW